MVVGASKATVLVASTETKLCFWSVWEDDFGSCGSPSGQGRPTGLICDQSEDDGFLPEIKIKKSFKTPNQFSEELAE